MTHVTVSFRISAYTKSKGFQVPVAVADALGGLRSPDEIALTIMRKSGETIFHGIANLASGTEVTAVGVCQHIEPGEELWIVASKPPNSK